MSATAWKYCTRPVCSPPVYQMPEPWPPAAVPEPLARTARR